MTRAKWLLKELSASTLQNYYGKAGAEMDQAQRERKAMKDLPSMKPERKRLKDIYKKRAEGWSLAAKKVLGRAKVNAPPEKPKHDVMRP